jgi:hypothetical protein
MLKAGTATYLLDFINFLPRIPDEGSGGYKRVSVGEIPTGG